MKRILAILMLVVLMEFTSGCASIGGSIAMMAAMAGAQPVMKMALSSKDKKCDSGSHKTNGSVNPSVSGNGGAFAGHITGQWASPQTLGEWSWRGTLDLTIHEDGTVSGGMAQSVEGKLSLPYQITGSVDASGHLLATAGPNPKLSLVGQISKVANVLSGSGTWSANLVKGEWSGTGSVAGSAPLPFGPEIK